MHAQEELTKWKTLPPRGTLKEEKEPCFRTAFRVRCWWPNAEQRGYVGNMWLQRFSPWLDLVLSHYNPSATSLTFNTNCLNEFSILPFGLSNLSSFCPCSTHNTEGESSVFFLGSFTLSGNLGEVPAECCGGHSIMSHVRSKHNHRFTPTLFAFWCRHLSR